MSESTKQAGTDTEPTGEDATTDQTSQQSPEDRIKALEADVAKWTALSRKHEGAAKAALKAAEKAPTEPAQETPAPPDPVAALRAEMVLEKAQDKLDAAAAKAGVDLSDLLEFVKVEKFVDDGRVDTDAITEFVTKFAAKAPKAPKFAQGIGVGPQGNGAPSIDQRIAEAEKARNMHEVIRLKREKARIQAAK